MRRPRLLKEPFPPEDKYFIVTWNDAYKQWIPGTPQASREEAVMALRARRLRHPHDETRLVRESRIYIAEDD